MYKNVKTYIKNKTFILCELYFGFFQTFEDSIYDIYMYIYDIIIYDISIIYDIYMYNI